MTIMYEILPDGMARTDFSTISFSPLQQITGLQEVHGMFEEHAWSTFLRLNVSEQLRTFRVYCSFQCSFYFCQRFLIASFGQTIVIIIFDSEL